MIFDEVLNISQLCLFILLRCVKEIWSGWRQFKGHAEVASKLNCISWIEHDFDELET